MFMYITRYEQRNTEEKKKRDKTYDNCTSCYGTYVNGTYYPHLPHPYIRGTNLPYPYLNNSKNSKSECCIIS